VLIGWSEKRKVFFFGLINFFWLLKFSSTEMAVANGLLMAILALVLCCRSVWADQPDGDGVRTDMVVPVSRWNTASKKAMQLGEACEKNEDCSRVYRSFCHAEEYVCVCPPTYPVNGTTICGQERMLNDSCTFDGECTSSDRNLECREQRCQCISSHRPSLYTGGTIFCTSTMLPDGVGTFVDPTMIGVLVGMCLMFIIMCVVLRLFSKARWGENRSIFNTPNPRLANASLLKDVTVTKPHSRRGSLRNGSHHGSLLSIPRGLNDPSLAGSANGAARRPSATRLTAPEDREEPGSHSNAQPIEAASVV